MTKKLLLITSFFLLGISLYGQLVPPCPSNTQPPADNCGDCIYCGFNGVQSSTAGYNPGSVPGFCGSIENNQWLGFIAGETGATFSAIPTSCTNGDGVQIALMDATCSSLLGCYGGQGGGASIPATISINTMVPGQTYYLMIDGFAGDQCSFTIAVSPNSAIVPPLPVADSISGPNIVCPNITTQYCTPMIPGAAAYVWNAPPGALINGQPGPITILGNAGLCVDITWPSNATAGPVIVNGINSCFTNTPPAIEIVQSIPLPPVIESQPPVCQEDFPYTLAWGTTIGGPGAYDHIYQVGPGCDSNVTHIITPIVIPPTILQPQTICQGQAVNYCGQSFTTSGAFDAVCTNVEGCDSIVKVILIVIDIDPAISGGGTLTCTNNSVTLYATPGPGVHAWYNASGQLIGVLDSLVVTAPGNYILESASPTGTLANCVLYDTMTVIGNLTPPSVQTTGGTLGCGGSTQITVSSNAANPSYAWGPGTTPSNNAAPSVSSPGNYIVTVTNQATGCTNTGTAIVLGSTDVPAVSLSGNQLNCAVSSSTITANTTVSGATFAWSTGDATPSISTTTAGTYTVTVTNPANNCTNEQSYVVNLNNTPPPITALSVGNLTCTNTSLNISTTSDSTNLSYAWSSGSGTTSSISVNAAGIYTVTATASNGCTNTSSVTITEDITPPGVSTTGGVLTCSTNFLQLNANSSSTSSVSFDWGGGNMNQQYQVTTPGSYTVTATGANGCTSTETAVVTQNIAPPNASATDGLLTCTTTSTTIGAASTNAGATFLWTGPNGGSYSGTSPTVNFVGSYTATVTNPANGCTSTTTAIVTSDITTPAVSVSGSNLSCAMPTATVGATSPINGATFVWSSGETMPSISTVLPGTYIVTVTDPSNSCTNTESYDVTFDFTPPAVTASANGSLSCQISSLDITTTTDSTNLTYAWTGGGTTPMISVTNAGTYTVTATASNGCTSTASVTIASNTDLPDVATAGGVLNCNTNTLNLNATSNTSGVTYNWGGTNTSQQYQVSAAGTYVVTVTAPNGCTNTETAIVTEDTDSPTISTTGGLISCSALMATLSGSSPVSNATYQWAGPSGTSYSGASLMVSDVGLYTVTVTNPDNGCTSTATATVDTNVDIPTLAVSGNAISCAVVASNLEATSSASSASYLWSSGETTASISTTNAGTYTVTVTDAINDCTNTESYTVSANTTAPSVSASATGILTCLVTNLTISTTADSNNLVYAWTNGDISPNVTISTPGTYTVTATASNGCTSSASATISQDIDEPGAMVDGGVLNCTITSIPLIASSPTTGVTYDWGNSNTTQIFQVNAPGSYMVTTTGSNGCTSEATALVTQNIIEPIANADGGIITCDVSSINLSGSSPISTVTFQWTGPNGGSYSGASPIVQEVGNYTLTVTNSDNGCTSTAVATVTPDAGIPNAAASSDTLDCNNTMVTIVGSSTTAGVSMSWDGPTGSLTGSSPTVTTPGDYTLTVLDPANGCTAVATTTVGQNLNEPNFSLAPGQVTCALPNTTIQLILDPPNQIGLTYAWTGPGLASTSNQNANVSQAGDYTIIVTGANGCTSSATTTVPADTNIPMAAASADILTCVRTSVPIQLDITATGTVTGTTWTGPNFNSNDEDPVVTEAGLYEVVVTTNNGCSSTATLMVEEDVAPPDLMITGGFIGCSAPNTDLNAVSAAASVYLWSGPNGFTSDIPNPNVSVNGNYSVLVTGTNGCTNTEMLTVTTDFDSASVTIASPTLLDCTNEIIELTPTITSNTIPVQSTVWTSNNGYFNDVDENPSDITEPGMYTLLVTTSNGCTSIESVVVNQDISEPGASALGNEVTCTVLSNALTGSSPTSGVSYAWITPGNATLNEQNPIVDVPGNYTLIVTGANGCTSEATVALVSNGDFPENVAITAPVQTITCAQTQVELTASTTTLGVTYEWFDPNSNSVGTDPILLVDAAGLYTVLVTDVANGCTSPSELNILINQVQPDASAVGDTTDCISGTGVLTGSSLIANAIFTWTNPSGGPISGQSITVGATGLYTLTVEDPANGCTQTTTAVLDANMDSPEIAVDVPLNVLDCNILDISLLGNVISPANPTISWIANGQTVGADLSLNVTMAGTYIFNVTDPANNCITSYEAVITDDYAAPELSTANAFINCSNPTVTISASSMNAGTSFEWTTPSAQTLIGANQTADQAGNYTVIATGINGCTSTNIAVVDENFTIPSISVSSAVITCTETSVILDSESSVSTLEYAWTGPKVLPNTADPSTDVGGDYLLVVTNTVNGCTNSATELVEVNQTEPDVTATGDMLTCDVTSIPITSSSTTLGVTYVWLLNGNQVSTQQNPNVSEAGTYTVITTDPINGCTSSATALVAPDENAPDIATAGGNIDCSTPSTNLLGSSITPNVTYAWSAPNGFASVDPNPLVDAAGIYTLTISSTDNGCTAAATATVDADFDQPVISIAPPDEIDCNNSSVMISSTATGQGNLQYVWTSVAGQILSGANSASPEVGAGNYVLVVTSTSNGCSSSEEIQVTADPATPSGVAQTIRDISCFGENDGAVILQGVTGGTPPFLYSFDNQPFANQSQWTALAPGTYPLVVQDVLGCEWATTFTIDEPEELLIDLGPDLISADAGATQYLVLGDSVSLYGDITINFPDRVEQLFVTPAEMYDYICDTCQGNFFKAFYTQRYEVTIVDSNGCKASDERLIVVDRTRNVYVPNVFNPDATDGSNHLLTIYGNLKHVRRIKSFKLFDRWGEAVHIATDFPPNTTDQAWDGHFNGQRVNPAVFVWVAEVEFIDGLVELYKGDVTVIGN